MIAHNKPTFSDDEEQAALRVIRSNWLAQGVEVQNFENEMCNFLGLPKDHAVAVSSGTSALYLALWVLDGGGKTISIPSYVCTSLRHAISLLNGKENVIDIDENSPNIDISELNKANPDIAIIPHMFGIPVDLSKIKNIKIIEDCAQSIGAKINGVSTGLIGDIGIFSFYATKLITSGGQGGMIVSKDKDLIDRIKDYREFDCRHDKNKRFNFQMTDLQAGIGREQLKKLPSFLKIRENIFQKYKSAGFNLLDDNKYEPVRYRAVLKTNKAKEIIESLNKAHIKSIVPIEEWELLEPLPNSVNLSNNTVSLPIYPSLSNEEIKRIIMEVIQ
ncbi:MAG TPA: DegT/DnrJ/EryC1/StrS family aminotransferase [Bacteroidales bacterium]|nr:DegT/DnrJ/EryC1/StrS family aminotransferase [Bacteroidales bacterium]